MLYEIPSVRHFRAKSVPEALFWLKEMGGGARVMAGGTDLLGLLKNRLTEAEVLVDIKPLPGMSEIAEVGGEGVRIGAGTRLAQLAEAEVIRVKFPLLAQAAAQVGTTQIRNMGTIGGNLCQRPQCLYFRQADFPCRKKGGARCFAVSGEHRDYYSILAHGPCVMAHPSDMAPALMALGARAIIAGSGGERETALEDFFLGPDQRDETVLNFDELLLAVHVPDPPAPGGQVFLKQRLRRSFDFALVSVAMAARISGDVCREIRIVLGGVAPFPYRGAAAEEVLLGKTLSGPLVAEAAQAAVQEARPLPMNGYKVDLTRALVERALKAVWQGCRRS